MPDVMTPAHVIEPPMKPPLWDLSGIDDGAHKVDSDALDYGSVKVPRPLAASGPAELKDWREARGRERDVKGYARPVHVCTVERRMPWQDNARNPKRSGHDDICPSAHRLAIKSCILGGHDACRNQQAYARVIHTRKPLHKSLLRYTAHGMPHTTANQALAGRKEKDGSEENVSARGLREVDGSRVEVEGDCENDEEADGVRPYVDELVVEVEG